MSKFLRRFVRAVLDRVNLLRFMKESIKLGKENGPALLTIAITVEAIESVVIPALLYWKGLAWLIPLALAVHTEPLFFAVYLARKRWLQD